MLRRRQQQIAEFAERMRANGVAFVGRGVDLVGFLIEEDVEVVEPEVGHHFLKLAFAEDGADDLGLHEFVIDDVRGVGAAAHRVRRSRARAG